MNFREFPAKHWFWSCFHFLRFYLSTKFGWIMCNKSQAVTNWTERNKNGEFFDIYLPNNRSIGRLLDRCTPPRQTWHLIKHAIPLKEYGLPTKTKTCVLFFRRFFCYFSGLRVSFPTPEGTKTTALELHALLTSKEANLGMVVFVPEVTLPKTDSLIWKSMVGRCTFLLGKPILRELYY